MLETCSISIVMAVPIMFVMPWHCYHLAAAYTCMALYFHCELHAYVLFSLKCDSYLWQRYLLLLLLLRFGS